MRKNNILIYNFLPFEDEDFNIYFEEKANFEKDMKLEIEEKIYNLDEINEKNIDFFIVFSLNKYISNLQTKNYENSQEFSNFLNFAKNSFENSNLFNEKFKDLKNLLLLYYDKNNYLNIIKQRLIKEGDYNNLFIILLYGFLFCIQSIKNYDNNNFYSSLMNKKCLSSLKENYIPGNNNQHDLHLYTISEIEKHFNNYLSDEGCYICSCGYYYSIAPCGFPVKEKFSKCPNCHEVIGYGINEKLKNNSKFSLFPREGHFRIFKNEEEKKIEMDIFKITDEMVPNKTYQEYKKDIILPILNKEKYGINLISKDLFLSNFKRVRNLSKIGFRLLHFILYSHLFFSNCLNYISDDDLKKNCLIEDMSCLKIIENDWYLLKEALYEHSINSIEIFMNLIYKKISKLLNKCVMPIILSRRNKFESEVEEIVKECIKNYHKYKKIYLEKNDKELKLGKDHPLYIIKEIYPPEEYSEKEYPLYKFFMLTNCPNKDDMIKKLKESKAQIFKYKYSLLNQILLENPNSKKIKYLNDINNLSNYLIDYYSFKISREKANQIKIKDIEIKDFVNNQIDNFINSWGKIYKDVEDYNGQKINHKQLTEKDKIINFLNDKKDQHLFVAYKHFILWQNEFLKPIYEANTQNGILHYYSNNLIKRIPIQEAETINILNLDDVILELIIPKYTKRNIFQNESIDYSIYNNFKYNFKLIEKELGDLILPGKYLFDENKFRFISFCFEDDTNIFSKFSERYIIKPINEGQKHKLNDYFDNNEINKNEILASFQSLINYCINNKFDDDNNINIVFEENIDYLNNLEEFFEKEEGEQFYINQLISIYFYLEELFFVEIKNEKLDYLQNLNNDKIKNINYKEKIIEINKEIDLNTALKRYFLRYLIDKTYLTKNSKNNIALELNKSELWILSKKKFEEIKEVLNNKLSKLNITVNKWIFLFNIVNNIID